MAQMSLAKLNELLERALRGLHEEGLSVVTFDEPKPWLPESYWARVEAESVAATAQHVLDLAEHAKFIRKHRQFEDDHLAKQDAATVIAEWDDRLPTLQGPNEVMARAGWGRERMRDLTWHTMPRPPTPGNQQPEYNNHCQFCYRPITGNDSGWKDHASKRSCAESPRNVHIPDGEIPWWEEDGYDDDDEDDDDDDE